MWARLRGLTPFNGVTGVIDFTSNTDPTTGYEPKNKRQALLGVDEIKDVSKPARVLFACGAAATPEPTEQDKASDLTEQRKEGFGCPRGEPAP